MWTDIVKLGTVVHTHRAPTGSQRGSQRIHTNNLSSGSEDTLDMHMKYTLPGSIGQFEDDEVGQVVNLPQPKVIGDVVPVHKGLEGGAGLAHV